MSDRRPSALEWAAWRAPVCNAYERAALVAIAEGLNRESGARHATHAALAAASGMAPATLKRTLAALAKRGLIAVRSSQRPGQGSIYVLTGWLQLRGLGEPARASNVTEIHERNIAHSELSQGADIAQSELCEAAGHSSQRASSERAMSGGHSSERALSETGAYKDKTLEPQTVESRRSLLKGGSQADLLHGGGGVLLRATPAREGEPPERLSPQALFAAVDHPLLDPHKATELVLTAGQWLDSWRRAGAEPALIEAVVRGVVADHARRRPGDRICTLKFFDKAVRRALAARAEAAREGQNHGPASFARAAVAGAFPVSRFPDATERERARTRARQSGWTAALAAVAGHELG